MQLLCIQSIWKWLNYTYSWKSINPNIKSLRNNSLAAILAGLRLLEMSLREDRQTSLLDHRLVSVSTLMLVTSLEDSGGCNWTILAVEAGLDMRRGFTLTTIKKLFVIFMTTGWTTQATEFTIAISFTIGTLLVEPST